MDIAYRQNSELKEFGFGLLRLLLGMIIFIELLVVLDFFVYLSIMGNGFSEKVATGYESGFDQGYARTYDLAFQEAYNTAHEKGYDKEYLVEQGIAGGSLISARVGLRNITFKELNEFLAEDRTNFNQYISKEYVCFDFAAELNNNAEARGIHAAYVRIRSDGGWGHAVVGFETVDRGMVFVEPQSDKTVELILGKPYPWQQAGAVSPSNNNDPVTEIQVIW